MSTELTISQLNQRIAEYHGYQFIPQHVNPDNEFTWDIVIPDGHRVKVNGFIAADKLYQTIRRRFSLPDYTGDDEQAMQLLYEIDGDWDLRCRHAPEKGFYFRLNHGDTYVYLDNDLSTAAAKAWLIWKEAQQ